MGPIVWTLRACLAAVFVVSAERLPAAEPEVEAAFQAVQAAVESRDVAELERRVHPGFEMLHALGQIEQRAGWLALVGTGRLPRQTAQISEYDIVLQRVGVTALRRSIVRFRDARQGRDMWLRGTATFVQEGGRWLLLRQQSTLLSDAPSAEPGRLDDLAGAYRIPGRDVFQIEAENGLLSLRWASGAVLPLIPLGPDRFASGPGSHMVFGRDAAGNVESVTRSGPEGIWWTARRARRP